MPKRLPSGEYAIAIIVFSIPFPESLNFICMVSASQMYTFVRATQNIKVCLTLTFLAGSLSRLSLDDVSSTHLTGRNVLSIR